jgi:hypothetical protein
MLELRESLGTVLKRLAEKAQSSENMMYVFDELG